jgi:hypothetical protein
MGQHRETSAIHRDARTGFHPFQQLFGRLYTQARATGARMTSLQGSEMSNETSKHGDYFAIEANMTVLQEAIDSFSSLAITGHHWHFLPFIFYRGFPNGMIHTDAVPDWGALIY